MKASGPYTSSVEFLRDYTGLLRLKLEREVAAARARRRKPGAMPEVEDMPDGGPKACNEAELAAREATLRARIAATLEPLPPWQLAETFGLSPAERELVLLLVASGLDERFGRVFAYLHDDVMRRYLTPGLAWRLLGIDALSTEAQAMFAPEAPLIAHEIVRVLPGEPGLPLISRPLVVDERIAAYVMGVDGLDERITDFTRLVPPAAGEDLEAFDPGLRAALANLSGTWLQGEIAPVCFHGPPGAGKGMAARFLADALGRPLLVVDTAQMPQSPAGARTAWRQVQREQRLRGALAYVRGLDGLDASVRCLLTDETAPSTVFASEDDGASWAASQGMLTVRFPVPGHALRGDLWRAQLSAVDDGDKLAVELAGRFRLTAGQIRQAAAMSRQLAVLRAGPASIPDRDELFEAARRQSAMALGSMAQKVTSAQTWEDLVLPPAVLAHLKAIVSQVRNAAVVYEQWGFGARQSYGKGLAALFSGPSGTGKTMSAGVIARALGLDMYKIDLARVVSKYIGETEKNLDQVFGAAANANAVLFFDEADALFGKRSEVKDAHDRYANIEISYLLQKMEEYDGLAILATNFATNLDEAFNRRLNFIIDFPLPRAIDREAIWRGHMPPAAPLSQDIDFAFLAQQFELTGGAIRNCVRTAAFAAAEAGTPIGMTQLVQAVAGELAKLGRPLQRSDFGEHFAGVTEARRGRAAATANGNGTG